MKQFFEQYGAVALGILALLVLVAMITPVGNIIKTSLQGATETFSAKIESQHDDALEATAKLIKNSTYLATDGDFNGLHYHDDELFTGTCEQNHLSYANGEVQISVLDPNTLSLKRVFGSSTATTLYFDSNNVKAQRTVSMSSGSLTGVYYDRYNDAEFLENHIYYFETDYFVSDEIEYKISQYIENNDIIDSTTPNNFKGNVHYSTIAKYQFNAESGHNGMRFYIQPVNGAPAGTIFSMSNIKVIDLTETYGLGNEPLNINQVKEDLHL